MPLCAFCQKPIEDWTMANVMVSEIEFGKEQHVKQLYPAHKLKCSEDSAYHNVWELSWVRDRPLDLIARLVDPESRRTWEQACLVTLVKLASEAHPKLAGK